SSTTVHSVQPRSQIDHLTKTTIGCAYKVYNTLGFGFLESVYEKSLQIELRKEGIEAIAQQAVKVYYENFIVGDFFADLLVEEKLIVELKSVSRLTPAHETQLVNYLNATGIQDGLLINFGAKTVEVKRKYKNYKAKETPLT